MADISQIKLPNNETYDLSVKPENIKAGYLENRVYLNTQPENPGSAVLPFLYNDLAFLTLKGGAIDAYLTTATDYTPATLSNRTEYELNHPEKLFDGTPSYCGNIVRGGASSSTDIRVIDLTLHETFAYSNIFYIDFGGVSWKCTKIIVLVMNSATETEYVQKINKTDNSLGHFYSRLSHTSTNSSGNTVQGFNRIRIVLSGFGANLTTGNTRIAQIGLINYNSIGVAETFVSRGGCEGIYGDLVPYTNNDISLGNSERYWAHAYIDKGYFTNTLSLYREGTTDQDLPAGIDFTVVDTTTDKGYTGAYIHAYQDHAATSYGTNLVIKPGGNLFIGSGEAPENHYTAVGKNNTEENTFLSADGVVNIQANANTIADRVGVQVSKYGSLLPVKADKATDNIGSIGASNYKWANGYFTNINGVAVGSSPRFTDRSSLYGVCSTAGGTAEKVVTIEDFDTLLTGVTIHVKMANTNTVANPTLNVNGTGAKPIYRHNAVVPGTNANMSWETNSVVGFTYDGSAWMMNDWACRRNDNTYDRTYISSGFVQAKSAIVAGNIIVAGSDNLYFHLKTGAAFSITKPILYANSAIAANATGNNNYLIIPFNVTTTQSITLTDNKPVYIKGNLSGTTFTPVSTTPLTQTVPTTADGYQYMLLGSSYSTTNMYLLPDHAIFEFTNGSFHEYSTTRASYNSSTETISITF